MRNHICPSKPKTKVDYKAKRENQSDKTARENRFYSSRAWQTVRLSVLVAHYHKLIHKLNINSKEKLEKFIEDLKKEKETGEYKILSEL